jgi:hypothetical protein
MQARADILAREKRRGAKASNRIVRRALDSSIRHLGAKPDKFFVDQAATPSSRKMPAMLTRTAS